MRTSDGGALRPVWKDAMIAKVCIQCLSISAMSTRNGHQLSMAADVVRIPVPPGEAENRADSSTCR